MKDCYFETITASVLEAKNMSATKKTPNAKIKIFFPSPEQTFCHKCKSLRPPRCHHCSVCNRCILQFDHHCVWLNNCVGYNNHRAFLLMLFYLSLGCCYGLFMLYRPYLELMNPSPESVGWQRLHDNITALIRLSSTKSFFSQLIDGTLENDSVLIIVFPFLTAIGLIQTIFLGYHLMYVVSAFTTLEHKVILDMQYEQILKDSSRCNFPQNPFSRGGLVNLKTVLGPIPLVFLPIRVDPIKIVPVLDTKRKKET